MGTVQYYTTNNTVQYKQYSTITTINYNINNAIYYKQYSKIQTIL